MNKYALYCKDTKQSFGPFLAICMGSFKSAVKKKEAEQLLTNLQFLRSYRMSFALVDQNGAVLIRDMLISKVEKEGSQVSLNTFQDLRFP
jgi:hypothetical protein